MSIITEDIRKDMHQEKQPPSFSSRINANLERLQAYIQEELTFIRADVRETAGAPSAPAAGKRRVFDGTRLWHEGDYRHGSRTICGFYAFLSQDTILNKEILTQRKKLFGGYRYEIRYTLTGQGSVYYRLFTEALVKEGVTVSSLFVKEEGGNTANLPYTACGDVKYDFELEHYLIAYPKLYYTWHTEV